MHRYIICQICIYAEYAYIQNMQHQAVHLDLRRFFTDFCMTRGVSSSSSVRTEAVGATAGRLADLDERADLGHQQSGECILCILKITSAYSAYWAYYLTYSAYYGQYKTVSSKPAYCKHILHINLHIIQHIHIMHSMLYIYFIHYI